MDFLRRLFSKPATKSAGGSAILAHSPGESGLNLGFSSAPAEWRELREKHYHKWLGTSEHVFVWHEVLPMVPHVDIYVFPPTRETGRNYFTLITAGMSDEKMRLPKGVDGQFGRAEIIFYVADGETKTAQTEKPWYVEAMSFYAHFPFTYKTWLAFSHTLPNGNPPAPVVEGSALTTALFLPAIFEPNEFAQQFNLGGERVNFLWLTYLSDKETEYKLKYGYDELAEKFNQDNLPQVFNPFRSAII